MVKPSRIQALAKRRDGGLVAEQRSHSRSSIAAKARAVTSSGVPEASMRRKRPAPRRPASRRPRRRRVEGGVAAADAVGAARVAKLQPAFHLLGAQVEQQGAVGKEAAAAEIVERPEAPRPSRRRRPDRQASCRGSGRRAPTRRAPPPAGWCARHGRRGRRRRAGPRLRRPAVSPSRRRRRIISAPGLPPGSRVSTRSRPRPRSASASASAGSTCRPHPRLPA